MNSQSKYTVLRSLGLLLLVAILVFGGIGITGAAAQAAIPGDALYPMKTTIEQTRLSFAADAGQRAELRLGYAEERLQEIQALISEGRFREVGPAVLAFESDLNGAILELDTVSRFDPSRGSQIALKISSALSRFGQTLSVMAASAPESVRPDVTRALDTTGIAGSLDLSSIGSLSDDDSNDNSNVNGDDNSNFNGDDDSNVNGEDSSNVNGDDDCTATEAGDTNTNADDSCNVNGDDDSNVNGDDNSNVNGDDSSNVNGGDSTVGSGNENGDDSGGGNSGSGGGSGSGSGGGGGGD